MLRGLLSGIKALDSVDDAAAANPAPLASRRASETPTVRSSFVGLDLTEAAVECLRRSKDPLTLKQMVSMLEAEDYEFVSEVPTRAINHALRKRANTRCDVFAIGHGRWGFRENFTEARIAKLKKKHAGMGGRTPVEHGKKTSDGLKRARASGKQVGNIPVFDAAVAAEIRAARALPKEQRPTLQALAEKYNVTASTIRNYVTGQSKPKESGPSDWEDGQPPDSGRLN